MAFQSRKGSVGLAVLALVGVVSLTACGSSDAPALDAKVGDSTLRVTSVGLCTELQLFWAQENGIFKNKGITVEVVKTTGGAAALSALVGNAVDVAYTSASPALIAKSQGLDIRWIATGTYTAASADAPTQAVVVPKGSAIRSGKSLEGKKIAVNELGGVTQLMVERFIEADGGDVSDVEFITLPFPQIAGAVADGTADAGQVPSDLAALNDQVESIGDPYFVAAAGKPFIGAGYAARTADADKKEYKAFYEAIAEASEQIGATTKDEHIAVQIANCATPEDILRKVAEPPYRAETEVAAFEAMQSILLTKGLIKNKVDVKDFIADYTAR